MAENIYIWTRLYWQWVKSNIHPWKYEMNKTYISDRKEKNKHEGEIKDIIAWMYPSMKEYFRNQRSSTSLRS